MHLPKAVTLYEVGPRDGLQNEALPIGLDVRVALVEALAVARIRDIEVASFVSPKWVPQMAGGAALLARADTGPDVCRSALTPNLKGAENALAAGADRWAVFTAASETFCRRNINCSIAESLARFAPIMHLAATHDIPMRAYISCITDCPYEGPIAPGHVAELAYKLLQMGAAEISLGETTGRATPNRIVEVIDAVTKIVPVNKLALHCHDTYGQALANILSALEHGVAVVDASVGGLGGCPYAPGAGGNVASEEVVYLLNGLGIETGVDLERLVDAAWFISDALGRPPRSKVALAMRKSRGAGQDAVRADSQEEIV